MNTQQLSEALTLLDDEILQEAAAHRAAPLGPCVWRRWPQKLAVAAAALAVMAGIGWLARRQLPAGRPLVADSNTSLAQADSNTALEQVDSLPADTFPTHSDTQSPGGTPASSDAAFAGDSGFGSAESHLPQGDALPDLPQLTLGETATGGMGFEGLMAYDIGELATLPWQEESWPATLPVFYRPPFDGNYPLEAMEARLRQVAGMLGLDGAALPVTSDVPGDEELAATQKMYTDAGAPVPPEALSGGRLLAETEGLKLEIDEQLCVTITFEPAVSLPAGLTFTHHATRQQLTAVGDWLATQYAGLLGGMQDPALRLSGGDYSFYGDQGYGVWFYDAAGDVARQMQQTEFAGVEFACNDEGKLFLARVCATDPGEALGDYPLVDTDTALGLLGGGHYQTTVPVEVSELDLAAGPARVELLYRAGDNGYTLPWYRFYLELPDYERENGLKTYGAYYVPAVRAEYITDMP